MTITYGCQTYTWQMSYDKYANKLSHIMHIAKEAGFSGIEPEVCMLGDYRDDPQRLAADLERNGLKLAALTLALPWWNAQETPEEKKEADYALDYLKTFPDAMLILVVLPGEDRSNLKERQSHALTCVNEVGRRANEKGISCAFHPNSPIGSVFRSEEDYEIMLERLDSRYIGYAPDTGHIANGGMDPLQVIQDHIHMIRHVHFKDINLDQQWVALGKGRIDHSGIIQILEESGYSGWVVVEEESRQAALDPDEATLSNGLYVHQQWLNR